MEMKKVEVKMNKPIYLGQAILDISKTLMYEFWYDYIKAKYSDKARLLIALLCILKQKIFTKILIMMQINGLILLTMIKMIIDLQKQEKTKKVIGKFKDEIGGKIMTEFCALRAKVYAYKLDDETEMKKAKGCIQIR